MYAQIVGFTEAAVIAGGYPCPLKLSLRFCDVDFKKRVRKLVSDLSHPNGYIAKSGRSRPLGEYLLEPPAAAVALAANDEVNRLFLFVD